jgi:hypothetical protein
MFSVSGVTKKLFINSVTDNTTIQKIYAYFTYYLYTAAGIAEQINDIRANDATNLTFYNTYLLHNNNTNALLITGGYFVQNTGGDPVDCYDITGYPIFMGYPHVVGLPYSSGSGLSTEEHNAVLGTNTTVEVNLDGKISDIEAGSGMTVGQFLALK